MIKRCWGLTLVMALLMTACAPQVGRLGIRDTTIYFSQPKVRVLHSPMQPTNLQTVEYTATAHAPNGVSAIHIWMRTLGTQ